MPGLRLTCRQAQRLWNLDEQTCGHVLDFLVEAKFLYMRRGDNTYTRLTDGCTDIVLASNAKAHVADVELARMDDRNLREVIEKVDALVIVRPPAPHSTA
jgi:hypothetical protein